MNRYLRLLKLSELQKQHPSELSGGQKQRVAMARELVTEPNALFLDEPLSHLDTLAREQIRDELKQLHKKTEITTCHVTHDQREAMILADRISVLHQGRIEQVETPEDIFYQPKTPFVAEFVEATNIFNVELVHLNGKTATFNLKNTELLRPLKLRQKSILSLPVKQSRLYACILKKDYHCAFIQWSKQLSCLYYGDRSRGSSIKGDR